MNKYYTKVFVVATYPSINRMFVSNGLKEQLSRCNPAIKGIFVIKGQ